MGQGRRFTDRERAALFLAADGRCSQCGVELEPGWHADHIDPWSRGGATDVINGQALCPDCNRKKGNSVTRAWQANALRQYFADDRLDWLACATPGSGKTRFALDVARRLLDTGVVEQVVVVVPTDALREQWGEQSLLHLFPARGNEELGKPGYEGFVVTYQQIARGAGSDLLRRLIGRTPTLAIFDELHHAGERSSWGTGLRYAFEHARRRLALTGTPWRQDRSEPIPFVTYDANDEVEPNFTYEYGEAVRDGVCRPVVFHAYDGEARWVDCGSVQDGRLTGDVDDDDVRVMMRAVLRPDQPWIHTVLKVAARDLDELRTEVPDAAGLVIAESQALAREYGRLLAEITDEEPTLVLSDDPGAKHQLDSFRDSRSRWAVAVRMISEGVDIPRLAVGVYGAAVLSPLFFRQVVGRFVRVRDGEDHSAALFVPAVAKLTVWAREIEDELRHQLDEERKELERRQRDAEFEQQTFELRTPLSASDAVFDQAIYSGQQLSPDEMDDARADCREVGIPEIHAAAVARLARKLRSQSPLEGAKVTVQPTPTIPQHHYEKRLRQEAQRTAAALAHRLGVEVKEVNASILRAGFPQRKQCTIQQLEAILELLASWSAKA